MYYADVYVFLSSYRRNYASTRLAYPTETGRTRMDEKMITSLPDDQPITPPLVDDAEQTFESFAATMPETASGFLDCPVVVTPSPIEDAGFMDTSSAGDVSAPRKSVNVSKKIRKAMNKFKGKVANVPIMWFHAQAVANDQPAWELDKDEQELITDSIDTVFEVLDVNFEIEPLSWTLTSIWWVISYPLLAFTFLFLTKKSLLMEKEQPTETQP